MQVNKIAKAVVGAVVAGLGALGTAMVDNVITGPEWVYVAGATVGALAIVWGVPNASTDK